MMWPHSLCTSNPGYLIHIKINNIWQPFINNIQVIFYSTNCLQTFNDFIKMISSRMATAKRACLSIQNKQLIS